jgi:hypothetical protein
MSPINYTILSRADDAGPSANSYYAGNFSDWLSFPFEKTTDIPVAWSMIGFFLSGSGIFVFLIVAPTWQMYRRRVAFVKSLERQEEAKEARANAGV